MTTPNSSVCASFPAHIGGGHRTQFVPLSGATYGSRSVHTPSAVVFKTHFHFGTFQAVRPLGSMPTIHTGSSTSLRLSFASNRADIARPDQGAFDFVHVFPLVQSISDDQRDADGAFHADSTLRQAMQHYEAF